MNSIENPIKLTALGVAGVLLNVRFQNGKSESVFRADSALVHLEGMVIEWPNPPKNLKKVRIHWPDPPFAPEPFRCECLVVNRWPEKLEVRFENAAPPALRDWFLRLTEASNLKAPDAALSTSRLYTSASVISALGLFCGAGAILLPLLVGEAPWIDGMAVLLLLFMLLSIGGFALLRGLAGRHELRAIRQGKK